MNFPTLYKKTSTGAIQQWSCQVVTDDHPTILTGFGQVGGKIQTAADVIRKGKNIGKANETSAWEQAVAEAKSQWEMKVKKGYVQSMELAEGGKIDTAFIAGGVEPMLAHSWDKQSHKIKYPAFVQPKLDGHRCIAVVQDGKCTLWSRTRKRITGVPHIERELESLFPTSTIVLDGELYNHDYRDNFEALTSFIRQETPKPGHEIVQYWVYDVVDDRFFYERLMTLDNLDVECLGIDAIEVIATIPVYGGGDVIDAFGEMVAVGWEGAMVRNANGLYKNKRSYDLQKVKIFDDSEFEVIGVEEGRGKMQGKALFVCKTDSGSTFRVKMKGALDDLKDYFDNPEPWIGRMLTVQYQGLTGENNVPRFPIGLRFREDV